MGDDNGAQPDPDVWPQCSECKTTYVLRRCYSLTGGGGWLWQRDCKHMAAAPEVVTKETAEL